VFIVPTSKDPSRPKQDPIGSVLSIIGLGALVFAIIEGGNYLVGWGDPRTRIAFIVAALGLTGFALWERHCDHPMLDTTFFKNPRFSAASFGIAAVFFAMFGSQFLTTQYLQLILGYSPFEAGVRLLPMAITMMIVAPNSPRFVERFGTKVVVATGLFSAAFALALFSTLQVDSSYLAVIWRMMFLAVGIALVMAPATESIMGSLPRAKAGVGSAVNDTTRQVGGALGIAVVGSVMSSAYSQHVAPVVAAVGLKGPQAEAVKGALGGAYNAALGLIAAGEPAKGARLVVGAKAAFIPGMQRGMLVAAAMAAIGGLVAVVYLPARATISDEVTNAPVAAAPVEA
jgi:Na+/melibiose symporter-like transporter